MELFSAKGFAQVNGILTLLLGVLGFVYPNLGLFTLATNHTYLHLLIAVVSLYFGFGNASADATMMFAKIFGVVYLLLGVLGFLNLGILATFGLSLWLNVVHILLGAWGAYAGFMNK